jgi:protein-disulfide isomerase
MKRTLPFLIIVVVAAVAAIWFFSRSKTQTGSTNGGVTPVATPLGPPEPGASPAHVEGPADALVTLEEFGDFQCPPCGELYPVLKEMEHEFGPRLRVIFRQFPLVPAHAHALSAARASEAAGLQGKFWQMHGLIYENQKGWTKSFDVRPIFEGYAKQIGLDMERYQRDLGSEVVQQRITEDGKRARSLNITGTPTVFLNGRELPFQSLAPPKLRGLIQAELNK